MRDGAAFSRLCHTWPTSPRTWSTTSSLSPRASQTSSNARVPPRSRLLLPSVCKWIRPRTSHSSLLIGDQIALLKGATFEVIAIRFNMVFNTKTGLWECGNATYCIEDAVRGEIALALHCYLPIINTFDCCLFHTCASWASLLVLSVNSEGNKRISRENLFHFHVASSWFVSGKKEAVIWLSHSYKCGQRGVVLCLSKQKNFLLTDLYIATAEIK